MGGNIRLHCRRPAWWQMFPIFSRRSQLAAGEGQLCYMGWRSCLSRWVRDRQSGKTSRGRARGLASGGEGKRKFGERHSTFLGRIQCIVPVRTCLLCDKASKSRCELLRILQVLSRLCRTGPQKCWIGLKRKASNPSRADPHFYTFEWSDGSSLAPRGWDPNAAPSRFQV